MIHAVVATKAGVSVWDIERLFAGDAHASVADRLNVPMGYVEDFINDGSVSAHLAECLGFNISAAEELGAHLNRDGRIGLIIGLLIAS